MIIVNAAAGKQERQKSVVIAKQKENKEREKRGERVIDIIYCRNHMRRELMDLVNPISMDDRKWSTYVCPDCKNIIEVGKINLLFDSVTDWI